MNKKKPKMKPFLKKDVIRTILMKKNKNQSWLALQCKINEGNFSLLLKGEKPVPEKHIINIALALDTHADFFLSHRLHCND